MGKIIKDIAIIGPEDKLIILADRVRPEQMEAIRKTIEDFLKSEAKVLIGSDMKAYVLKDGAKVSLIEILESELKKRGKK